MITTSTMMTIAVLCTVTSVHAAPPKVGDVTLETRSIVVGNEELSAESGTVFVPENRGRPDSPLIELAFLRFKTKASDPLPPVIFLAGGPGGSGTTIARTVRFSLARAILELADVIFLDQRGTGQSKPSLRYAGRWNLPLDQPLDAAVIAAAAQEQAAACVEHFHAKGIDLSSYNTNESADDVADLARALGAPKIVLWGSSYGTHLGLAVVRRHEPIVARAMFFGVEGPDHTLKLPSTIQLGLERVAALVRADETVGNAVPDLVKLVADACDKLDREPVTVELFDFIARHNVPVVIGKFDLQYWVAEAIGRTSSMAEVPSVVHAVAHGDYDRLASETMLLRRAPIGSGMSLAMDYASGVSIERAERIARESQQCVLGDAINAPFMDRWENVGIARLGEEFRGPLQSQVPVLWVSGSLDSRTPQSNVEELQGGFPNGQQLLVENATHDEALFSRAAGLPEAVLAFLRNQPLPSAKLRVDPPKFKPIKTN